MGVRLLRLSMYKIITKGALEVLEAKNFELPRMSYQRLRYYLKENLIPHYVKPRRPYSRDVVSLRKFVIVSQYLDKRRTQEVLPEVLSEFRETIREKFNDMEEQRELIKWIIIRAIVEANKDYLVHAMHEKELCLLRSIKGHLLIDRESCKQFGPVKVCRGYRLDVLDDHENLYLLVGHKTVVYPLHLSDPEVRKRVEKLVQQGVPIYAKLIWRDAEEPRVETMWVREISDGTLVTVEGRRVSLSEAEVYIVPTPSVLRNILNSDEYREYREYAFSPSMKVRDNEYKHRLQKLVEELTGYLKRPLVGFVKSKARLGTRTSKVQMKCLEYEIKVNDEFVLELKELCQELL